MAIRPSNKFTKISLWLDVYINKPLLSIDISYHGGEKENIVNSFTPKYTFGLF